MKELILGIDEAGRGPVIGPMVICGIVVKKEDIPELVQIGVKDSKLLSPATREKLKKMIEKIANKWELIKISPSQIDEYGMTYLHLKSIAQLISKFCPQVVIIDCPTRWPNSYERNVRALTKDKKTKLVVENFADGNYSIVAAASILAKVARDEEIKNLSLRYGQIGSGYPSDQKTIEFLKKCLRKDSQLPDIVRKRWKTIDRVKMMLKERKNKNE